MSDRPTPWTLAALLDAPPGDFAAAVRQAAELGFTHVDIVARAERPAADVEALADAGVTVRCAALGRGLPPGCALDAADAGVRREALRLMQQQAADAARLGATHAYVVAGADASAAGRARFAEACGLLADFAARRMLWLCVEPAPGRALPDAAAALDWLEDAAHPELALLLDVGHCLISGEDPAAAARRAGPRLGYVHLDDNDGMSDLHWPLLTGRLTRTHLEELAAALRAIDFRGGLALELKAEPDVLADALRRSKAVAEQALFHAEGD
jgi:sugar phosphate isomerase/epimerase